MSRRSQKDKKENQRPLGSSTVQYGGRSIQQSDTEDSGYNLSEADPDDLHTWMESLSPSDAHCVSEPGTRGANLLLEPPEEPNLPRDGWQPIAPVDEGSSHQLPSRDNVSMHDLEEGLEESYENVTDFSYPLNRPMEASSVGGPTAGPQTLPVSSDSPDNHGPHSFYWGDDDSESDAGPQHPDTSSQHGETHEPTRSFFLDDEEDIDDGPSSAIHPPEAELPAPSAPSNSSKGKRKKVLQVAHAVYRKGIGHSQRK